MSYRLKRKLAGVAVNHFQRPRHHRNHHRHRPEAQRPVSTSHDVIPPTPSVKLLLSETAPAVPVVAASIELIALLLPQVLLSNRPLRPPLVKRSYRLDVIVPRRGTRFRALSSPSLQSPNSEATAKQKALKNRK